MIELVAVPLSFYEDEKNIETITPMLKRATDKSNGELTPDDMIHKVLYEGAWILYALEGEEILGLVLFEISEFPSGKRVVVSNLVSGKDIDRWLDLILIKARHLAKHEDCEEIYVPGRKAWERKLKPMGFKHVHSVMSIKV